MSPPAGDGEDDRAAILARRRVLVAAAVAGLVGCGSDPADGASSQTAPLASGSTIASAMSAAPSVCLTASVAEPPPSAAPSASASASSSASASAAPEPAPCLSVERAPPPERDGAPAAALPQGRPTQALPQQGPPAEPMTPRVLLVWPGTDGAAAGNFGCPQLVTMGTYVREKTGAKVEIVDLHAERAFGPVDLPRLFAGPDGKGYDVIGFSCYASYDFLKIEAVAAVARATCPDAVLCAGGYHASARPAELFEDGSPFDAVVVGEGEKPLAKIVEMVASGSRPRTQIFGSDPIEDLDELPPSDWSLLAKYIPVMRKGRVAGDALPVARLPLRLRLLHGAREARGELARLLRRARGGRGAPPRRLRRPHGHDRLRGRRPLRHAPLVAPRVPRRPRARAAPRAEDLAPHPRRPHGRGRPPPLRGGQLRPRLRPRVRRPRPPRHHPQGRPPRGLPRPHALHRGPRPRARRPVGRQRHHGPPRRDGGDHAHHRALPGRSSSSTRAAPPASSPSTPSASTPAPRSTTSAPRGSPASATRFHRPHWWKDGDQEFLSEWVDPSESLDYRSRATLTHELLCSRGQPYTEQASSTAAPRATTSSGPSTIRSRSSAPGPACTTSAVTTPGTGTSAARAPGQPSSAATPRPPPSCALPATTPCGASPSDASPRRRDAVAASSQAREPRRRRPRRRPARALRPPRSRGSTAPTTSPLPLDSHRPRDRERPARLRRAPSPARRHPGGRSASSTSAGAAATAPRSCVAWSGNRARW
jgi:hypothetical protein